MRYIEAANGSNAAPKTILELATAPASGAVTRRLIWDGQTAPTPSARDLSKNATLTPFDDWIRHGSAFDGVVDFDAALHDPAHPERMLSRFDSGDHLHPGDTGNKAMADAVDLNLVLRQPAKQSSAR